MAAERQLWLQDTYGAAIWFNVSDWVDLFAVQHTPRAEGDVSTLTFTIRSTRPGDLAPLPLAPIGGCEVMYFIADAFGTNSHDYRFGGEIVGTRRETTPDGWVKECACASLEHELNAIVNFLAFDPTAYRYDTDRVQYLLETLGALSTTWDGHSAVSGPFVDYQGGATAPGYYRQSLWDILQAIATTVPTISAGTTARRWWVGGAWADATFPGDGPMVRTLHYYAGLSGPQEAIPLTDSDTAQAHLVAATFTGPNSALALPPAETTQSWTPLIGTWGVSTNRAYLVAHAAGGLVYIDSYQADLTASVVFAVQQSGMRLAFRAVRNDAWAGKWEGLVVQNGGTDYSLWKREAGVWTQIGASMAVTPANGDVVQVITAGSSIKVYINGVLAGTFTSTFNQTATLVGLAADTAGAGRWDSFTVTGAATQFSDPLEEWDYTGLCNTLAVAGPGADPVTPSWQNGVFTTADGDRLTKTDAPAWQASHTYVVDEVVRPVALPNGRHYVCTVSGTTAATEPAWPTVEGQTTTNGTVTWECRTWDAGATTPQVITEDGGYVAATLEETLLVVDGFSRADGALGKTETGQPWTVLTGAWAVENGHARCAQGTSGWLAVDAGAGLSAVVEVTATAAPAGWRLAFRILDSLNAYYVQGAGPGGGCDVIKRQGGSDTILLHSATDITAGTVVKVRLLGASIELYLNGVWQATSAGNTFLQGATQHGCACSLGAAGASRWDNFHVRESYTSKVLGVGALTTVTARADIAYGIFFDGAALTAQAMEGGAVRGSSVAGALGDSFKVELRPEVLAGTRYMVVRYWRQPAGGGGWALFYTSGAHPTPTGAAPFVGQAVFFHVGATLGAWQLRRFTYGMYDRADSVAAYGRRWAKTVVHDDLLDTDTKRQAFADNIFDRYAYPRTALEVLSPVAYSQGRRALVNYSRAGLVDTVRIISQVEETLEGGDGASYRVRLGDSPYEYGDDEPLGTLIRIPDRDPTEPEAPSNWREGVHEHGVGQTWTLHLLWDAPPTDAQWLEAYVQKVGEGWRRFQWPAARRDGPVPDCLPGGVYRASGAYRDFNGNAGGPSPTLTIPLPLFGQPPAPAWAAAPFPAQGYDPDSGPWADVAWEEVAPAYQPGTYWINLHPPTGYDRSVPAPAGTARLRVLGLRKGTPYTVTLQCEDIYGVWSDGGTPLTLVIGISPQALPPSGGTIYADGTLAGWTPSDPLLVTVDPAVAYKTMGAYAVAPAALGTATLAQDPIPVQAGVSIIGTQLYYKVGPDPLDSAAVEWHWYDDPDPSVGTNFATDTDPLDPTVTTWKEYAMKRTAPATALCLVMILLATSTATPGTLWVDAAVPPQAAKGSMEIGSGAVGADERAEGTVGTGANQLYNPHFEIANPETPHLPDGWLEVFTGVAPGAARDNTNPHSGAWAVRFVLASLSDYDGVQVRDFLPVHEGTPYQVGGWAASDVAGPYLRTGVTWYDASQSPISSTLSTDTVGAAYAFYGHTVPAPAGTAYAVPTWGVTGTRPSTITLDLDAVQFQPAPATADGTPGATATTGGLTFKDGLLTDASAFTDWVDLGEQTINDTETAIAHGLSYTPTMLIITPHDKYIFWQSTPPDATYVYITMIGASSAPAAIYVR